MDLCLAQSFDVHAVTVNGGTPPYNLITLAHSVEGVFYRRGQTPDSVHQGHWHAIARGGRAEAQYCSLYYSDASFDLNPVLA
jgi:hypothetical protein